MDNIWEVLELEPTQDISAIKRAYAKKTRICHPEEDPEGFLKLREAYQAALDYAATGVATGTPTDVATDAPTGVATDAPTGTATGAPTGVATGTPTGVATDRSTGVVIDASTGEPTPTAAERQDDGKDDQNRFSVRPEEPEEEPGWFLQEEDPENLPNPYEGGEAIRRFLDLYTGKQRKNPKLWMDYFSSDTFLDAGWDSRFTTLLLKKVTELEETCPPGKEFLTWLSAAYELTEETPPGEQDFDGLDAVRRIAARGRAPKRLRGNEFAMLQSFRDYRHLVRLAESGRWDQEAKDACREVLGRYVSSYIRERCEQRVSPDCERHPAGLRLLLHFFRRDDLPEAVYRDAWQQLNLKSAVMGRAKILYGPLRDRVLERVPGIDREEPENFFRVNKNLEAHIARVKADPAGEEEASAAFFANEEVQKALTSLRFIEKELLTYSPWRREDIGEGLVRRIRDFYRVHPDIPRAAEVAAVMEEKLQEQSVKCRNREDAQAETPAGLPHLAYRPFFRHWLNTGFYTARDPESGMPLQEYLVKNLPYQKEWSRRFAEKPVTVAVGNVKIDFYPLHMEFQVDGEPVYRPCLTWEQTAAEQGDGFFFLLPMTAARDACDEVAAVILNRLSSTAAPEEDKELIARCLADWVCRLSTEKALPLELCAESKERLYVCAWLEGEGPVTLYQQTASGRRIQREYRPDQGEAYLDAARRLLAEAVSPDRFELSRLRELPWNIYFTAGGGSEEHLRRSDLQKDDWLKRNEEQGGDTGEDENFSDEEGLEIRPWEILPPVTEEALSSLLVRFGQGELERLEMDWAQGRLVLCRDGGKYACLYFEKDFRYGENWYALLSDVEMYQTVDCNAVVYLPFGMGKLPAYSVHDSAASLMGDMEEVLAQMGRGPLQSGGQGGWKWSCNVNRHNARHKMWMAQQKMGGVPPQRSRNEYLLAKFVSSRYPARLEYEDLAGERTLTDILPGGYGQAAAELIRFMQQKLARLRLTWTFRPPQGEPYQRHMILLQDNGRFMLLWLQDDKARADAYASDSPVMFLGHVAPACLVHRDLLRIRNCVDLLLDDIDNTEPVVDRPGEFVPVSLPYREIRAELVKED